MNHPTADTAALEPDWVRWRHDFHRFPETGFNEQRTSERVAQLFQALGLVVHRGVGGTGVVASLQVGKGPGVVGLRADMDLSAADAEGGCLMFVRNPRPVRRAYDTDLRALLHRDAARVAARVLVINTEGATAPGVYVELTGCSAAAVLEAATCLAGRARSRRPPSRRGASCCLATGRGRPRHMAVRRVSCRSPAASTGSRHRSRAW